MTQKDFFYIPLSPFKEFLRSEWCVTASINRSIDQSVSQSVSQSINILVYKTLDRTCTKVHTSTCKYEGW